MSRVSRNLEHQDSLSWEDTSQMLYNNSKKKGGRMGEGRGRENRHWTILGLISLQRDLRVGGNRKRERDRGI